VRAPVTHDSIAILKKELEVFRAISPRSIEGQVSAAGFRCRHCAKCCSGRFGDNTVTIFPSEIRAIMAVSGSGWFDVARPHESGDVDACGVIHTFEWVLRKKENGDCAFLGGGRCAIYDLRPLICRTYPMRLEGEELELYECDGLGTGATDNAPDLACTLVKRQIAETAEMISLLEKLDAMPEGAPASGRLYAVHDGEGTRMVVEKADGSFSFL